MTHVCLVSSLYPPDVMGGAELSLQLLAHGLAEKGFKVTVICCAKTHKRVEESDGPIDVIRLPSYNVGHLDHYPKHILGKVAWRALYYFEAPRYYATLSEIKKLKPDVVHLNQMNLLSQSLAIGLKDTGVAVVQTTRDCRSICDNLMYKDGKLCERQCSNCAKKKRKDRAAYQCNDHTICISKCMQGIFVREGYVTEANSSVIYNAVNDLGAASRSGQEFDVGYIGALTLHKGIDVFIELANRMPNRSFCIASMSPFENLARFNLTLPKNVSFLGTMEQLDFFSKVRVVAMPTNCLEAFGRVAAEALSASRPVIVSDRGGLPEIVIDGEHGFVIPPDDIDRWVEKSELLLANHELIQRMGAAGRKRYEDMFQLDAMLEKHVEVYETLCN